MDKVELNDMQLTISIPIEGIHQLISYQQGIRGLLRRIEIGNCDPELKENIKTVISCWRNSSLMKD